MNHRRIFVDMDGTLAKWNNVETDMLYEKGYYENLEPNYNLLNEIKELIRKGEDIYILSSFLSDSKYALEEKKIWLSKYLTEIPIEKQIFVKYGSDKTKYIPDIITKNDYLIDDYTKNLLSWKEAGGVGIKFLNGINHTKGTWKGLAIKDNETLKDDLEYILDYPEKTNDTFNQNLLELSRELSKTIHNYKSSIHGSTENFLNAELDVKEAKEKYFNEKQKIMELYDIEIIDSWHEESSESIGVHYKISFKDGRSLYEGYGFIEDKNIDYNNDMLINEVLNFNVKNKTDITKVSPELRTLVDAILSSDSDNCRLYCDDLSSLWDISETDVPDKIDALKSQLRELNVDNCVDINMIDTYPKTLEYIDINSSIISEFDFSNDGKHSRNLELTVNDKEVVCNLEYNANMGGWAVSGYTVDKNQMLTKEELAMLQSKIFNEINKIYDEEFPKINESEFDIDITDDMY